MITVKTLKKYTLLSATFIGMALSQSAAVSAQDMVSYKDVPAGAYELDKTHASLVWKVMHMGLARYTAQFTDFDVTLNFDPADPTQSTLSVSVDPLSIKTNYPYPDKEDFDKKLSTLDKWFNGEVYKTIDFKSTAIEMTGEKTGKVHGDLTLLGVTKPVTLDVTFNGAYQNKPYVGTPALGFSAETTIKRSEWGFDTYVPNIADEVDILIETEFHKKKAE